MKLKIKHVGLWASFACLMVTHAARADCTDVIALSRTTTEVVQSQSSIESHAKNFCSEYKKGTSSSKSASYGASYKLLSASMSKSGSSQEEVASKYCSADSSFSSRDDAYKTYSESISPDAYRAYESCIALSKRAIFVNLDPSSMLPTEFSMAVSYKPDSAVSAKLRYTASKDVKCSWSSSTDKVATLTGASSTLLECSRDAPGKASYVGLIDENSGAASNFNLVWPAYTDTGVPVNLVVNLKRQVEESRERMEAVTTSLNTSVVAFNAERCPSGWDEYPLAYGRVIRGVDKSGAKVDPDGLRAPGTIQADAYASHAHTYQRMTGVINGTGARTHMGNSAPAYAASESSTSGGTETRAKNVALLYCTRK